MKSIIYCQFDTPKSGKALPSYFLIVTKIPFYVVCLLILTLFSCQDENVSYTADNDFYNSYAVDWINKFGLVNPQQNWNMASLVTADITPSDFGNGATVYIYTDHPIDGGMLIGKANKTTTLKLDMLKDAQSVWIRAVDANGAICYSAAHQIINGTVNMSQKMVNRKVPSRSTELAVGADGNVFPWMIVCEDLGSIGDYDFNDVVIGLQHTAGTNELKVYPMACGGTLKAEIYFKDILIGEIHNMILSSDPSNSYSNTYTMINTLTWGGAGDVVNVEVPDDWTFSENLSDLHIIVQNGMNSISINAPKAGSSPQLLCLKGDWFWPKERFFISECYPDFSKLNASAEMTYDWMQNVSNLSKVVVWKFPLKEFDEEGYDNVSIPKDPDYNDSPDTNNSDGNKNIPNPQVTEVIQKGYVVIQLEMTGIWDQATNDWLTLCGTGNPEQNVWIEVDGTSKGVDVYNISSEDSNHKLLADVVFLIDNSGSMSQEANAVANSVISWSQTLVESNIDVRVGCVGYGEGSYAINGAFNLNTPSAIKDYLNYSTGCARTQHFGGPDASSLKQIAQSGNYSNGSNAECGLLALRYAHDNYNFREGANRIYINFTDEVNQPNGNNKWSVEYLNPVNNNWLTSFGTVHSVISDKSLQTSLQSNSERPWLMSDYTGGTIVFTDTSFTGVTLETLQVTGAMQNSYLLRFTNVDDILDGKDHVITIKVKDSSGNVFDKSIIYNSNNDYNGLVITKVESGGEGS